MNPLFKGRILILSLLSTNININTRSSVVAFSPSYSNKLLTSPKTTTNFQFLNMSSSSETSSSSSKHTLYDMPVSNNGARVRLILYKKKIPQEEVTIQSPATIGGLKSSDYLSLNPQGKMPLLTCSHSDKITSIPESDTICRYLLQEYSSYGPSFLPNDCKSNLIARLHDVYIGPIQGCMYKATPPFGMYQTRSDAFLELKKQLSIVNDLIDDNTNDDALYLCGSEVSLADATLFPTIVFVEYMLPKFGIMDGIPEKMNKWFLRLKNMDTDFGTVYNEIHTALQSWDTNKRWDTIHQAGIKDEAPPTIFDKIISGDIPAAIVKDTPKVLAFKDINPAAPAHVLVIPKNRDGLSNLRKATKDHVEILGELLVVAGDIAKDTSLGFGDGARIVINDGKDGGQEVPHLHVHVLGGRQMTWPPG